MIHNEFEKEEKYKLYRTVREILHPTISKKNISNYKIIVGEEYIPLRVAYPKKVSNIERIIIYIHGNSKVTECEEKYSEISANLARDIDSLVISIDYEEKENIEELYSDIYETMKFVYTGLLRLGILNENITLAGDSTGASIILGLLNKINEELKPEKLILFYPVLSGEYFGKSKYKSLEEIESVAHEFIKRLKDYYKGKLSNEEDKELYFHLKSKLKVEYPKTLVLCGNVDPLIDEAKDFTLRSDKITLQTIPFASHGFLNTKDKEIIREYNNQIKKFIQKAE